MTMNLKPKRPRPLGQLGLATIRPRAPLPTLEPRPRLPCPMQGPSPAGSKSMAITKWTTVNLLKVQTVLVPQIKAKNTLTTRVVKAIEAEVVQEWVGEVRGHKDTKVIVEVKPLTKLQTMMV